ncbi:MAG: hypothetical protein GTN62_13760 [Gemmatimonadales bacterium]|nr:hypothetical protein [Gemmatimonadales bacterium]NIN13069.1 hypothetical protein [Gemmatimonadales bacterium]NIN51153.1 hypothetical protein [Gemmatimonadales bacterium]NIP08617.1 hypothetical protein [Gemmatimonadales bacterium]NIR02305.1 hypothetical protein [Gemmatimonadales bacterium]
MATAPQLNGVISIGARALHTTRRTLMHDLGEDAGQARLQEIGYAGGEELYRRFLEWLPGFTGISNPRDLDAAALTEVLSTFFHSLGWGTLTVERLGKTGLAISLGDWAEAEPGADTAYPSCFFSAGLFSSFLTSLAGDAIAVMEVECRTAGDERCRLLVGSPEILEAVYQAMSEGQSYEAVFEA